MSDFDPRQSVSATATGTNAGATATIAAVTNQHFAVTSITGRSDAAAQLQILGGATGTTVLWQVGIQANVPFSVTFDDAYVLGTRSQAVSGKVTASTAACEVNVVAGIVSVA